jgi:hypothetical protein
MFRPSIGFCNEFLIEQIDKRLYNPPVLESK